MRESVSVQYCLLAIGHDSTPPALVVPKVMESQLRKRMEQVKELFADCTDVFEELMAVKKHLTEKIEECQSAVENIQGSVSKVDASEPMVETQIQVCRYRIIERFTQVICQSFNRGKNYTS